MVNHNVFHSESSSGKLVENMTDKTPIGIPALDNALGGGIPRGYVILLEVDTGTRSDAFLSTFLATGLSNGELAYILCTKYPLSFPYAQLQNKGIDVDKARKTKQLVGIDAFTDAFGWGEFKPESEFAVHDLGNSRHIHDVIRKVILTMKPKQNLRGVVDSLTSIIHAARDPDDTMNYVHHQMSAQKNQGNILLYTIAREAHDEEDIRMLEHIVDGVIALYKIYSEEGWQIAIQIEKMRGIDFEHKLFLYEVNDGDITLSPFSEYEGEEEDEDEDEEQEEEDENEEELDEIVTPEEHEAIHPPIPPVPEPEEAPETEIERESTSESETSSDEPITPLEPIIFDEPESSEESPQEPPTEPPEETKEPEDDEEDTFFF